MNARVWGLSAFAVLAFVASGCGGSSSGSGSSGGSTGNCSLPAFGICIQFDVSTLTSAQVAAAQSSCVAAGTAVGATAAYTAAACPTANALSGTCSLPTATIENYLSGAPITAATAYFAATAETSGGLSYTADTAHAECITAPSAGMGGTWNPGGTPASCSLPAFGICIQFDVSSLTSGQVAAAQSSCVAAGTAVGATATYAAAACATTNVVAGFCSLPSATIANYLSGAPITAATAYFATAAEVSGGLTYTSATAQAECTTAPSAGMGGTWY